MGWLVGAGGGWALALAGLSAGDGGAGPATDLIVVGGVASWVGLLVTAFRPGRPPNLVQKVAAFSTWLMPITMFLLRDHFNTNWLLLSVASAVCVTVLVVIYPSQSSAPRLDADRRLELHLRRSAAEVKPSDRVAVSGGAVSGAAVSDPAVSDPAVTAVPGPWPRPRAPFEESTTELPRVRAISSEPVTAADQRAADEPPSNGRWSTPTVSRRGTLRRQAPQVSEGGQRALASERGQPASERDQRERASQTDRDERGIPRDLRETAQHEPLGRSPHGSSSHGSQSHRSQSHGSEANPRRSHDR